MRPHAVRKERLYRSSMTRDSSAAETGVNTSPASSGFLSSHAGPQGGDRSPASVGVCSARGLLTDRGLDMPDAAVAAAAPGTDVVIAVAGAVPTVGLGLTPGVSVGRIWVAGPEPEIRVAP